MTGTLIEKLESLYYPNGGGTLGAARIAAIGEAIAIVRQHEAEQEQDKQPPVELAQLVGQVRRRFNALRLEVDSSIVDDIENAFNDLMASIIQPTKREPGDLRALEAVASIAAQCIIDLRFNLKEAEREWKEGTLSKGAYYVVQNRFDTLHLMLHAAGYTEQHKVFDFPVKPKTDVEGEKP